mmetsp:Transcript_7865/g.23753  ORF Transcript_7865/g.23753 Transcript_7865/m.23753 type:complete len:614 (+) Transcript_7865:151-1992(+)|eukprot:CAMPEP_0198732842 /NCGR_PEP_ID=MMETSP1475-20131203/39978_1 /TAXON_ID= ORGANISM="Unidentified sp., Strain CCMP1999" /NCGR_SAMPLE_ID=MMETSP1475 /ASSEMBLY_ACC=CAM_ASM_001111 /LENGTH=613 /DNA_ID=CAMNT_0044496021 /DNA_START=131 /DNA_END=1972 /DNA_ORIENTATION=+
MTAAEGGMATFALVHDRSISPEIFQISWCDKMDLLAVALDPRIVSVHRLNWQRVLSLDRSPMAVRVLKWSPDGRSLAVGDENGTIRVYDVETGKQIQDNVELGAAVSCLEWLDCETPPRKQHAWEYMRAHTSVSLLPCRSKFNVLAAGDDDGFVHLRAFSGHFSLCKLKAFNNSAVQAISVRPTLDLVMPVSESGVSIRVFDTHMVSDLQAELQRLGADVVCIRDAISHAQQSLEEAKKWEEAETSLRDNVLAPLEVLLENYNEDLNIGLALSAVASGGQMSPALQHYFSKEKMEGSIRRALRFLSNTYEEISTSIQENLCNGAEDILFRCSSLKSLSRLNFQFRRILRADQVDTLVERASGLLDAAHECFFVLITTWSRYIAFCKWLIWKCMQQLDEENTNDDHGEIRNVFAYLQEEIHADSFNKFIEGTLKQHFTLFADAVEETFENVAAMTSSEVKIAHSKDFADLLEPDQISLSASKTGGFDFARLIDDGQCIASMHINHQIEENESATPDAIQVLSIRHYREHKMVYLGSSSPGNGELQKLLLAVGEEDIQDLLWRPSISVKKETPVELVVGVGRGLASIIVGRKRIITYDLEDVEESEAASADEDGG